MLTAPTTQSSWTADPETTWQLTDTRMTSLETDQAGEGPEIDQAQRGRPEQQRAAATATSSSSTTTAAGGYRAFVTSGAAIASSQQSDRLSQRADWNVRPMGGLPASPRHGVVRERLAVGAHRHARMDRRSPPCRRRRRSTADGALSRRRSTAADGGDVAGTVTFSGGDWSETVDLVDGAATASVPPGVTSVTARYDGYRDALVSPSTSSAVTLAGLELDSSATTRCVAGKVSEVVSVKNVDDVAATVTISGAYGSKSFSLAPGKTVSTVFATRAASIAGDTVTVTGTSADGQSHSSTSDGGSRRLPLARRS